MEARLFSILDLPPGRYSRNRLDQQYRRVRKRIVRAGGPDLQRRLDDALIAHALLRNPAQQARLVASTRRDVAARQRRAPMRVPRAPGRVKTLIPPPVAPAPAVARPDQHERFARMVAEHVNGGVLRMTSRRRLGVMARGLGIEPFKATLIIAEVLHDIAQGRRGEGGETVTPRQDRPASPSRYGWRVAAAVAAAVVVDVLLVLWLR